MISPISDEEYSYSFLFWPNMITATSTLQSTLSSCAFLNRPPLRFRNVLSHCQHDAIGQAKTKTYTDLFLSSLMRLISILRRPMMNLRRCAVTDCCNGGELLRLGLFGLGREREDQASTLQRSYLPRSCFQINNTPLSNVSGTPVVI